MTGAHRTTMPVRPVSVALFNDTGDFPHVGCLAVSQAHRYMLRRANAVVRHAFFTSDWRQFELPSLEEATARALASPELRRVFAEAEAVVVNGEGTIHHGRGRHLIGILAAAQQLGLPTYLVNAVLQEMDEAREILRGLHDCTVRDTLSAAYLTALDVPHRLVPDSIFEADFLPTAVHDFTAALVITDCHPDRTAEFRDGLATLARGWQGPVVRYELESYARVSDWRHAVADLSSAAVVVTGRHHGACLAIRAGVPFVTLPSNTWKIEGLLQQLDGYPARAGDVALPLRERVQAALRSRAWFADLRCRYPSAPLSTFRSIGQARPALRAASRPSPVDRAIVEAVRIVTRPGGAVLQCGAGTSDLVVNLLGTGVDAWGMEVSPTGGPCPTERLLIGRPELLPVDDGAFGTVVVGNDWLEHLEPADLERALLELSRVTGDAVIAILSDHPCRSERAAAQRRSRSWWEQRFLEAGFRRHSRSLAVVDFESLEEDGAHAILVLQRLPSRAATAYPLRALAAERDLHMDMLRETGRRADAHIARYEWARAWIRPGDVVVDAACGLGYGSALLWDGSEASRVAGLDLSDWAIGYARANYADTRPGLEFRACDVEPWEGWANASVDCIVSFETLEHLVDPRRFLEGARRVLKPGGRFLCSVPHAWVDDTGHDPNPHHLHVFDLDRLVQTVSPFLLIDQIYAQSAGGHTDRFAPRRLLRDVGWPASDAGYVDRAEWLLLSGVKDPLERCAVAYTETVFPSPAGHVPNAIAVARDYANPWAVHAIVMGSFRVRSPLLLTALAERWLESSPPDSADAGAALCVLAYRALDGHGRTPDLSCAEDDPAIDSWNLVRRIRDYCAHPATRPQVCRWQVSLLFVLGQIHLWRGDLAAAEAVFRRCAARDATAFTPHLETKTTEAAWLAGRLALERGDTARAAADWTSVASSLDRLKAAPVTEWLINPERPAAFETGDGLREIALAIDNATLCANGLRRLRDPGGVWRPGPEPVDRNHQRNVARLLDTVQQRGGEIQALRAALADARAALHQVSDGGRTIGEASLAELSRCRAERAALLARLRTEMGTPVRGGGLRIGIFGTGSAAMRVWEGVSGTDLAEVVWFADNDASRHGQKLLWIDVLPPAALAAHPVDAVIIGSMHVEAIRTQLRDLGVDDARIIAPDVCQTADQLRDRLRDALTSLDWAAPAAAAGRVRS
jgi:SAM-dependent methyltransferase